MKWIKIEDELPEILTFCLIYFSVEYKNGDKLNKIGFSLFNSEKQFCVDNEKVKPSHWMPLPEPPESYAAAPPAGE